MGPGPYDPFDGPAAELVMLLMGTIGVLVLFVLGDVLWRRLRRQSSRSRSRGPDRGV